jgi:hypothetical protein
VPLNNAHRLLPAGRHVDTGACKPGNDHRLSAEIVEVVARRGST